MYKDTIVFIKHNYTDVPNKRASISSTFSIDNKTVLRAFLRVFRKGVPSLGSFIDYEWHYPIILVISRMRHNMRRTVPETIDVLEVVQKMHMPFVCDP